MMFFFIVRQILKKVEKMSPVPQEPEKLPKEGELAALPPGEEAPKELSPRERAIIISKEQPEKVAEIIRAWLRDEVV
jgi:flagellar biosynthesis/type III secretory pathway M-ring protein FliF/YscJ